jgi:hypothetical protein
MPVHARYVLRSGSRCVRLLVYARARPGNGSGSSGRIGLAHDTPGATVAYVREGEPAREITLVPGRRDGWTPGGFVEIDPELVPGLYQLDVPDQMAAEGSAHALLLARFAGAAIDPVEVELVGYDPSDADRMGMVSLDPVLHGRFLRMGMPGLARLELALWDEADRESGRAP